ncbi:hypothetical protein PG995_005773 [Apiospora arundinis]
MTNKSRHTKQQGHHTDRSKSSNRQQHQHHRGGHTKPEPVAMKDPIPPSPSWSPMAMTPNFAYSVLQSPDGQPLGWKISGPSAMENTYNAMPRATYPAYQSPPNLGTAPVWTGTASPSSAYGPQAMAYRFPAAAATTQSLGGSTAVEVPTSAVDRGAGGDYAQTGYTQAANAADAGANVVVVTVEESDGRDSDSGDDCEYAPPPSERDQKKTKKKKSSSSSHRSHHPRESDRHQRHRSRSAAAPRKLTDEEYQQAEKVARSWQIVGKWLVDDLRQRHY